MLSAVFKGHAGDVALLVRSIAPVVAEHVDVEYCKLPILHAAHPTEREEEEEEEEEEQKVITNTDRDVYTPNKKKQTYE